MADTFRHCGSLSRSVSCASALVSVAIMVTAEEGRARSRGTSGIVPWDRELGVSISVPYVLSAAES